jgi:ribosomal protein S18 acetylase RimI-like enzyme
VEVEILSADAVPGPTLEVFLRRTWGADVVVAHGERIVPSRLPGMVALSAGELAGHASYRVLDGACEVTSIAVDPPRVGIGSRLMDAILVEARRSRCRRVWLTTTNDNLDALRFYQRRGFRIVALRAGAVDEARRDLKPDIPQVGSSGIPMRDELDLVLEL